MEKNGIHIIDVDKTIESINSVSKELLKIASHGGNILFVGTKKQAKEVVQENADKCGMFYVNERWLGGTLTNFSTIKRSIKRLKVLEKDSSDVYKNLTKKELSNLNRERNKLSDLHRGIRDMRYLPAALFVVDANNEKIAILEAKKLCIPVFGIVDSKGNSATYTGKKCEFWAGGSTGQYCAAQGNMLIGESTVSAMIKYFVSHSGNLADRLLDSLIEGERIGGDKRGRQSCALLVVRPNAGVPIYNNNLIDLRVDSHISPCKRLKEILEEYYDVQVITQKENFITLNSEIIHDIQLALFRLGRYSGELDGKYNKQTKNALWSFCVVENQKHRWTDESKIDPKLYEVLIKFSQKRI